MQVRALVLRVVALFAVVDVCRAATYTIRPDGSGDLPTIQAAVDAAQAGDEIVLASGTFVGEGNRGVLIYGKALTIRSASGDPANCIVDCDRADRGFYFWYVTAGVSVLEGVTVTNGGSRDLGGGIKIVSADVVVRNCDVIGNEAVEGGGLFLQWSSSTIEGCLVAHNVATQDAGGGIFAGASTAIRSSTLVGNTSGPGRDGGGLVCAGLSYLPSTVTVESTIIARSTSGNAVDLKNYATVELSCCDLYDNVGGDWVGGALGQEELRGNFSADPRFCANVPYALQAESPCAPPGLTGCGLIGARPVGCGAVAIEETSWGRVKTLYRTP